MMNDDDLTLSFEINSLMMLISDYQGQFRLLNIQPALEIITIFPIRGKIICLYFLLESSVWIFSGPAGLEMKEEF